MTSSKQLLDLQELDKVIDSKQETLATVKAKLGDDQALRAARGRQAKAQDRLRELRSNQLETELQLSSLKQKADALEKKLYSGSVMNPRELSSMQDELKILRAQQKQMEDRLLETLVGVEEAQVISEQAQEELGNTETQRAGEKIQLTEAQKSLQEELTLMETERQDLIVDIDKSSLSLYESLRKARKGFAVAKIVGGLCQGCRIELPTKVSQQVRSGQKLVQCGSCGRILHLT